jgi:hypothetical protein
MLFELTGNQPKYGKKSPTVAKGSGYSRFLKGTSIKEMDSKIGTLADNETVPYATGGQWSFHEVIEYCARQVGPCALYLTTWAVSEDPVRCIAGLRNEGLITELHCLFDHRIRNNAGEAYGFITELATSHKLTRIHAKIAVMIPASGTGLHVTIITSANLTNNKRIEAGTILTGAICANINKDWILEEINGQQPLQHN